MITTECLGKSLYSKFFYKYGRKIQTSVRVIQDKEPVKSCIFTLSRLGGSGGERREVIKNNKQEANY